jgi:hypothetical protein
MGIVKGMVKNGVVRSGALSIVYSRKTLKWAWSIYRLIIKRRDLKKFHSIACIV